MRVNHHTTTRSFLPLHLDAGHDESICIVFCCFFFFVGDEVIEWNGQSLNGRSAQEVHDIIADSRHDLQVELIVSRVIAASRRAAQASWRQSHSPTRLHHAGTLKRRQCAPHLIVVLCLSLFFILSSFFFSSSHSDSDSSLVFFFFGFIK